MTAPWRHLFPYDPSFLPTEAGRLAYIDTGPSEAEETLIFVHGNPTWSFHWRRLIADNQENYRCVAIDHLGCGESDPQPRPLRLSDHIDNLARLVEQLDLQRVTLVAQDWGGAIGLGALLRDRDRYERIALFNTGAFRPWFIPWRIRVCRWPVVGRLAVQGGNAFSRAALRMTLSRSPRLPADVAAAYLAPYNSWSRRSAVYAFVRDIPLTPRHLTWSILGGIEDSLPTLADMPIMLCWGMRDWCFTPECLERFRIAWPDARVHAIADAGHWVVEDAPEECSRALAGLLQSADAAAAGATPL